MGKCDVVIERASFLSFKNCSLVKGSNETCCCYATWHSWLVSDTGSSRVVILDEGTLNKGNHFLNKMSTIGFEYQLSTLVLLKFELTVVFF